MNIKEAVESFINFRRSIGRKDESKTYTLRSVSYTHLDVYKRQLFGLTATFLIVGVQLLVAGWLVWAMIRAPD